jgi:DNA polymerase-3 subunit alpha/error-prone DNA polymerase
LPKIEVSNKHWDTKSLKIKKLPIYQRKYHRLFYIESPAMRGLLRRLKCDNYKTVAASLLLAGVAKSGMMKEYILDTIIPINLNISGFEEQLGYGIMVYQEDVIKIALHFGGFACRW